MAELFALGHPWGASASSMSGSFLSLQVTRAQFGEGSDLTLNGHQVSPV